MARKLSNYYYHPIPGSRDLVTRPVGGQKALLKVEKATRNEKAIVDFNGERLHKFTPVSGINPTSLMGEFESLDPLAQVVFIHLFLLAVVRGADWCRVGMSELCKKTGLSKRRLLRTLSELVAMGKIKPLDRDRNGTLYKIYSVMISDVVSGVESHPPEIKSKDVHGKKPQAEKKPRKKTSATAREKPVESPINEEMFPVGKKIMTIKEIAVTFFDEAEIKHDDVHMDEAIAQITYLLEDGFTREEVIAGVRYLARDMGKKASIDKLPYIIHQALEAEEAGEL